MNKKITPEQFVKLWQTSKTLDEAVEKIGLSRRRCTQRASEYRKRGVPLKKMPRFGTGKTTDWQKLAEYARSLNEKEE